METDISSLFNYCEANERISIGGQPSMHQFDLIKKAGKDVVFQLVVEEASYSPQDEAYHVESAYLEHETMKVSFANPTMENVEEFTNIMNKHQDKNIYVHCAVGYCTSGLLSIYLMKTQDMTFEEAKKHVLSDWHPNDVWKKLIENTNIYQPA